MNNLREAYARSFFSKPHREIVVRTDISLNTLADVRTESSAGCHRFHNACGGSSFIIWRASGERLYLEEHSLDVDLIGGFIALRIENSAIIPGTQIFEVAGFVQITVPTAVSVHRFIFQHPDTVRPSSLSGSSSFPSIFSNVSVTNIQHASFALNSGHHAPSASATGTASQPGLHPHTATSLFSPQFKEATLFALGRSDGSILLVTLPSLTSRLAPTQDTLCSSSVLRKISSWITKPFSKVEFPGDAICSICFDAIQNDIILYAVTADCRLQIWSCKSKSEIRTVDAWKYIPECRDAESGVQALSKNHRVRLNIVNDTSYLTLFAHSEEESRFIILLPESVNSELKLNEITQLAGPEASLIDYTLTHDRLFTLCLSPANDTIMEYAYINLYTFSYLDWMPIELSEYTSLQTLDKESPFLLKPSDYCSKIFCDGLFSYSCVEKCFEVLSRGFTKNLRYSDWPSLQQLAVNYIGIEEPDEEPNSSANFTDVTEKWKEFYSACLQYHSLSAKPLALLTFPGEKSETCYTGVIRQHYYSLFYPRDNLVKGYADAAHADGERDTVEGTAALDCLLGTGCDMISDLLRLNPDFSTIVDEIASTHRDGTLWIEMNHFVNNTLIPAANLRSDLNLPTRREIVDRYRNAIGHLPDLVNYILGTLTISAQFPSTGRPQSTDDRLGFSRFLTSTTGLELMTRCMKEMIAYRYTVTRNLYILLVLMDTVRLEFKLTAELSAALKGDWLFKLGSLWQHYSILNWISNSMVISVSVDTQRKNAEILAQLNLVGVAGDIAQGQLILHHFISGSEGIGLRQELAALLSEQCRQSGGSGATAMDTDEFVKQTLYPDPPVISFESCFTNLIFLACNALWPSSHALQFPVYLLRNYQHDNLFSYCVRNTFASPDLKPCLMFLKACAMMHMDRLEEAYDEFLNASRAVDNRQSLLNTKLLHLSGPEDFAEDVTTAYFLKVVRILQSFDNSNPFVIRFVQEGLNRLDANNPNVATLRTLLFKCYIEDKRYDMAYQTLKSIPDPSSKLSCLRQYIVTLIDHKQTQLMVKTEYSGLERNVVDILESRAHAMDLESSQLYQLMFVFYVHRHNYRNAAKCMHEYALRLNEEVAASVTTLDQQLKCYQCAINALSMVEESYAWIVRPKLVRETAEGQSLFPKAKNSTDKVEMIEVTDLRREYILVGAKLKIASANPAVSTQDLTITNVLDGLLNVCEFDDAVVFAKTFDLPITRVLEHLVSKCVGKSVLRSNCSEYEWLDNNKTYISTTSRLEATTPVDHVWNLLKAYLETLSLSHPASELYRSVARKLISGGYDLPLWFQLKYQTIDPSELIRLLTEFGMLTEAQKIMCRYIDAHLGINAGGFGLKNPLLVNDSPVCFPYGVCDHLLSVLEHESDQKSYSLYRELSQKTDKYFAQLESSNNKYLKRR